MHMCAWSCRECRAQACHVHRARVQCFCSVAPPPMSEIPGQIGQRLDAGRWRRCVATPCHHVASCHGEVVGKQLTGQRAGHWRRCVAAPCGHVPRCGGRLRALAPPHWGLQRTVRWSHRQLPAARLHLPSPPASQGSPSKGGSPSDGPPQGGRQRAGRLRGRSNG